MMHCPVHIKNERRSRPLQANLTFVKTGGKWHLCCASILCMSVNYLHKLLFSLNYLAAYITEPHSAIFLVRNSIFGT